MVTEEVFSASYQAEGHGSSGKRHFTEVFLPNYRITVSQECSVQLV